MLVPKCPVLSAYLVSAGCTEECQHLIITNQNVQNYLRLPSICDALSHARDNIIDGLVAQWWGIRLTINRSWVQLPVGSLSSGYYVDG